KASSRARVAGSVRSFTATTSRSLPRSSSARRTLRPMRPNPLMAMRVMSGDRPFGSHGSFGSPSASPGGSVRDRVGSAMVRKDHARLAPGLLALGEGAPVLARGGAEDPLEVGPQVGAGAES